MQELNIQDYPKEVQNTLNSVISSHKKHIEKSEEYYQKKLKYILSNYGTAEELHPESVKSLLYTLCRRHEKMKEIFRGLGIKKGFFYFMDNLSVEEEIKMIKDL